jgi:hypothetical protein
MQERDKGHLKLQGKIPENCLEGHGLPIKPAKVYYDAQQLNFFKNLTYTESI